MKMISNKKVIYTALFGKYDNLIEPEMFDGWDYICFTDDQDLTSTHWKIIYIATKEYPSSLMNRMFKWLPHKFLEKYDISLYIDANVIPLQNPNPLIEKYLTKFMFAAPRHSIRECLYQESSACILRNKSNLDDTFDQITNYVQEGFPIKFGLSENTVLLRKHNEKEVVELMESVWQNLLHWGTKRDQLSLIYCIWKLNSKFFVMMDEKLTEENEFFKRVTHKAKLDRTLMQRLQGKIKKIKAKKNHKKYVRLLEKLLNGDLNV